MHRLLGSLTALALSIVLAPSAGADVVPPYHPSQLTHLDDAQQVVVVTSGSWSSSYATLRTFSLADDGVWREASPATPARIGAHGFAPAATRRQSTSTTPAGTFALPWAFGSWGAPGSRLPYYQFDSNDWWSYDPQDPSTYNVLQYRRPAQASWRTSWAERLRSYAPQQYGYAAVIDYNLPGRAYQDPRTGQSVTSTPADTRRGGGIFLHVANGEPTAGCVAVGFREMQQVLRWLDPAKHPMIVMGPATVIDQM